MGTSRFWSYSIVPRPFSKQYKDQGSGLWLVASGHGFLKVRNGHSDLICETGVSGHLTRAVT